MVCVFKLSTERTAWKQIQLQKDDKKGIIMCQGTLDLGKPFSVRCLTTPLAFVILHSNVGKTFLLPSFSCRAIFLATFLFTDIQPPIKDVRSTTSSKCLNRLATTALSKQKETRRKIHLKTRQADRNTEAYGEIGMLSELSHNSS